ncbi:MAG TPA: xanthine dehydrogenase family protein subunit M [Planctomycetota bacterium]|nr:xanthine dehydrogenase family protein subunit M [Planctomycetota bacterium]
MTALRAVVARDLGDAVETLATGDPDVRVVAGGTDVMVAVQAGTFRGRALLDIWRLPEPRGVRLEGGVLAIGALESYTDLQRDPLVRAHLPSLVAAAATIGGVQIQNRGTLGGNLANASPAGDTLPVLLALDAEVECVSRSGTRRLSVHDFFVGYRRTALRPDELLVRILVPIPAGERLLFRKVGTRAANAISKVVLAACVRVRDGALESIRIGAGSLAPTPIRLPRTEALLRGRRLDPALADEAGLSVAAEVRPIDDVRSTAAYRRRAAGNILRRWLLELAAA